MSISHLSNSFQLKIVFPQTRINQPKETKAITKNHESTSLENRKINVWLKNQQRTRKRMLTTILQR